MIPIVLCTPWIPTFKGSSILITMRRNLKTCSFPHIFSCTIGDTEEQLFAIHHVQALCCSGGTQLCWPQQSCFTSSANINARSSVPTHRCLFDVQIHEKVLGEESDSGFSECFVYFYSTACLASAAFYNIWTLYRQQRVCWLCPTLFALEQQQVLLVKRLLFCRSTKEGM